MSSSASATGRDVVDPEVRAFLVRMAEGAADHPSLDGLTYPEARRVAELVRAPWREGGPEMKSARDLAVATPTGAVGIRILTPRGAAETGPALIYLHGGGWTLFSIDTHERLMREYADRAGMVVVGVDYSLSPEAKFPIALNEVTAVADWLQAHGVEHGVDPNRIALAGDSAGGNLSMATALKLRDEGRGGLIKAVLLNYAALDFTCSQQAADSYGGEGFMLEHGEMKQFWDNYLSSPEDAANPLAVPAVARLEGLPPTFLAVAECDLLAEQNEAMLARLKAAGVDAGGKVYVGATHSFLEAMSISSLARDAIQDGADWLRARLAS